MISNYEFKNLNSQDLLDLAASVLKSFEELNVSPDDVRKVLAIIAYTSELLKIEKK